MNNLTIRALANLNQVKLWEVADEIGVSESTFFRLLRREVEKDKEEKIVNAIKNIKKHRNEKFLDISYAAKNT